MSKKNKNTIVIVKNQTIGGGDRYCQNTIEELKKKFSVVIRSPKPYSAAKNSIFNLLCYVRYVYFYLPSFYKKIGREISEKKYFKVIVFQDAFRKCPDIFRTLKLKSIYILHEPPREFYEPLYLHAPTKSNKLFTYLFRGMVYFTDRHNTSKASIIVTNSQFSKNRVWQIYKKRSIVVYPGLHLFPGKATKRLNQCVSVGSLLPYKGHDLAIKAVGRIKKNRPNLVIVGNGSEAERTRLQKMAKALKVQLSINRNVSDSELGGIYKESKIYINTAYKEPFGMTSLEGLGHGCNLVTVNNCGTVELKKFYPNNVFISDRDPDNIAKHIIKAFRSNGPETNHHHFSWERVAKELINLS